jgi:hypothetical protein
MMRFPVFPKCSCHWHPPQSDGSEVPLDFLKDPLSLLPAPVEFTAEMATLADRYWNRDVDWSAYPAYQAAAFLQPKSDKRHSDRRQHFQALRESAESQGFAIPSSLIELFTTDSFIDRLHHNMIWPMLPRQIVRLPADPAFAVLLFLVEGQGCDFWHVLLSPEGAHTVIYSNSAIGVPQNYSPGVSDDFTNCEAFQCMDSVNHLLYYYFKESARDDQQYIERLTQYFSENAGEPPA